MRKKTSIADRRPTAAPTVTFAALEHLFKTAPVGLCLIDLDLRYVRINERLAQINGRPVSEHIGRHIRDVVPEIAEQIEPLLRQLIETGEPIIDVEIRGTTPAEPAVERQWVAGYYPLKSDDGAVEAISTIVQEITDLRKAEQTSRESE